MFYKYFCANLMALPVALAAISHAVHGESIGTYRNWDLFKAIECLESSDRSRPDGLSLQDTHGSFAVFAGQAIEGERMNRAALLKILHAGARNMSWDEETRRTWMYKRSAYRRAKECSDEEQSLLVDLLRDLGA